MSTARQYPLPLPHREAMEADDFMITGSNREAVAWIDKWPDWPLHALVVHGPAGSGKTHLAHVWQTRSRGKYLKVDDLASTDIGTLVMSNTAITIDDADKAAGDAARERNLLHLYNILREIKGSLLLTAHKAPAHWNIGLADLRSRLLASPATMLAAPNDELLSALIIKQFGDRQIEVGADVIDYLLSRLTRTPDTIRAMVTALDRASLAEGRKITVALARRIMDSISAS